RGAGPYVLDLANTTYILATDIRTPGTAFVATAANIELDLNGHTVTYGDSPPVSVYNGDFEQGSGNVVPGWDVTGAPTATLVPNTSFLFGNQVLQLRNFSTTQRLLSQAVTLPTLNRTYTATITPAQGSDKTTLKFSVIDAVTGAVLGSGVSANVVRGF